MIEREYRSIYIGSQAYRAETNKVLYIDSNGKLAQIKAAHIVDADGALADITSKFNTLLTALENAGILASS